jgi:hypothetical protein
VKQEGLQTMNIIWTLLSTVLLVVLGIAGLVVFEVTVHPGSQQREKVGTAACVVVSLLTIGLWVWHFASGGPKRKQKKTEV